MPGDSSYAGNFLVFGGVDQRQHCPEHGQLRDRLGRPGGHPGDVHGRTVEHHHVRREVRPVRRDREPGRHVVDARGVPRVHAERIHRRDPGQLPGRPSVGRIRRRPRAGRIGLAEGGSSKFQVQPRNPTATGANGGQCDRRLASTPHAVMQVGLGDGSVRSIRASMDPDTWAAALTPAGGEILGSDW